MSRINGDAKRGNRRKSRCTPELSISPVDRARKSARRSSDTNTTLEMSMPISTDFLAKKLDEISTDLLQDNHAAIVELKGFEQTDSISAEEYHKKREEIRQLASDPENFDAHGRTELNIDGAAIAGAKLLVDEQRATRSMMKQLKENCGIDEDEVLYKPIGNRGFDLSCAKEAADCRKASVVESLVDYKKQIQFKANVLQYVADKDPKTAASRSKSDSRVTRATIKACTTRGKQRGRPAKAIKILPQKTPSQHMEINPLDGNRIIDEYALEVASEVRDMSRKRRRIAPIPFNIHLLDDEDDDDVINALTASGDAAKH